MKIIAINGNTRKDGNTSILLKSALERAKEQGAEAELISLYDLKFKDARVILLANKKMENVYVKMN